MSAKQTYKEKLLDPRWQKKRLQILERDGWACRCCSNTEKTLHVHHVHYDTKAEGPWDYADTSLVTLCATCHEDEEVGLAEARTDLIASVVAAGFWQGWLLTVLADAFRTEFPMEEPDAGPFVAMITAVMRSRSAHLSKERGQDLSGEDADENLWLAVKNGALVEGCHVNKN